MQVIESRYTSKLIETIKANMPNAVVFKVADRFTSGMPDICITWRKKTIWLEVKVARPRFNTPGIQWLTASLLEVQGACFYVVYDEHTKTTSVYLPSKLKKGVPEMVAPGFAHLEVVRFLIEGCM